MPPKPDTHPEIHRKLAVYHFRKWLQPDRLIPIPSTRTMKAANTVKPNPEPGGFLDTLNLQWVGGKRPYVVAERYRYDSTLLGEVIEVPAGYHTDFASVPRIFWRILPPHGPYVPAAVLHDWLCELKGSTGCDYKQAAAVFLEAMEVLNVPRWKRATMYRAVKYFGPKF